MAMQDTRFDDEPDRAHERACRLVEEALESFRREPESTELPALAQSPDGTDTPGPLRTPGADPRADAADGPAA